MTSSTTSLRFDAGLQCQRAAVGHGVFGVEHQVQQDLLEEFDVERDLRQIGFGPASSASMFWALAVGPRKSTIRAEDIVQIEVNRHSLHRSAIRAKRRKSLERSTSRRHSSVSLPTRSTARRSRGVCCVFEILGEQLQIQRKRVEVVLDLVDEPTREFGQFEVLPLIVHNSGSARIRSDQRLFIHEGTCPCLIVIFLATDHFSLLQHRHYPRSRIALFPVFLQGPADGAGAEVGEDRGSSVRRSIAFCKIAGWRRKAGPWLGSKNSQSSFWMRLSDSRKSGMFDPWCASITPTLPSL